MATAGPPGRGALIMRFFLRYTGRLILGLGVGWAVAGVAGFLIYLTEELLNAGFGTGRESPVTAALFGGGITGSLLGATAGAILGAWLAPGPTPEFRRRVLWRSVWSALAASLLGAVSGALCVYVATDRRPVGALAVVGAGGVLAGVSGAAFVVLYTRRSARASRWRSVVRAAAVLSMAIVPCAPAVAWLLAGAVAEMRQGNAEPIYEGKTTWQWIEELEKGPDGRRLYAVAALRYASVRMREPAPPLDPAQVSAAVAALTRALGDSNAEVRRYAADSLAHFDRDAHSAVPRLRQALKDDDAGVRVRAARALYVIGEPSPEALTVLLETLKDPDVPGGVRRVAAQGLSWVGPDAGPAIPVLRRALSDDEDLVRKAAAKSLEALQAPAPPAPTWDTFTCKEGGFSVLMPGSPREQTPADGLLYEGKAYEVRTGDLYYVVSFERLPPQSQTLDQVAAVFNGTRDIAVRNANGTLLSERRITLGKTPGQEILYEGADAEVVRRRCYVAGKRFYRLVAGGTKEKVQSKEAERFLNSFRLLGHQGPP